MASADESYSSGASPGRKAIAVRAVLRKPAGLAEPAPHAVAAAVDVALERVALSVAAGRCPALVGVAASRLTVCADPADRCAGAFAARAAAVNIGLVAVQDAVEASIERERWDAATCLAGLQVNPESDGHQWRAYAIEDQRDIWR